MSSRSSKEENDKKKFKTGGNGSSGNGNGNGDGNGNGKSSNGEKSKPSTSTEPLKKDSKTALGTKAGELKDDKSKQVEKAGGGRGRGRGDTSSESSSGGSGSVSSESGSSEAKEKKMEIEGTATTTDKSPEEAKSTTTKLSDVPSIASEQRKDGRALWMSQQAYVTKPQHIQKSVQIQPGMAQKLLVNYFRINLSKTFQFVQYRVDFNPEESMKNIRRRLISLCSATGSFRGYVYDGDNMIFLTQALASSPFHITVQLEREQKDFVVTFRKTDQVIGMTDAMATHILNCMLKKSMLGLELKEIQRNLFDDKAKINLPEWRLELWPGYVTSIRKFERDVLVCCEVTHKVMRQDTVYDALAECLQRGRDYRTQFEKQVIGTIVLTRYNNKTYRIDDVKYDQSPKTCKFEYRGSQINLVEYYRSRYNINIRFTDQPLLLSAPKARSIRGGVDFPALLVPELCVLTGLTDSMRNNFQMMKALSEYTRMEPRKRVDRLNEFSRRINQTQRSHDTLESFGVELERELVALDGRKLPQEKILFGNGGEFQNDDRVDWTPAFRNSSMYKTEKITRWGVVFPSKNRQEVDDFLKCCQEVSRGLRVEIADPRFIPLPDDRPITYSQHLAEFCSKDPRFIMIVLPNNSADRYISVKNVTYVNHAIPNQVMVLKTMMPKRGGNMSGVKSVATKVVIQMVSKLGGVPWMISMPLSGTMIIGYDATHDTANKANSYGAFVASMDLKKQVKFYSAVERHRNGEELSANISVQFQKALITFRAEHGSFPERILFYRDGVGEGQIQYVNEYEVKKLEEIMATNYGEQRPKFAFIIVTKRINTRIFTKQQNRIDNPASGTVVDDVVTYPERYDFFLISQCVRQGTVSPTYYNVISDSFGLNPERMQILTYKLCHLYFNFSGTVRVPAVVQYAHKLSVLIGQFIRKIPNSGLDLQLYYL